MNKGHGLLLKLISLVLAVGFVMSGIPTSAIAEGVSDGFGTVSVEGVKALAEGDGEGVSGNGVEQNPLIVNYADGELMLGNASHIIDHFSGATFSWSHSANAETTKDVVFEGTRSLAFGGTVGKNLSKEISSDGYLAFAIFVERVSNGISSGGELAEVAVHLEGASEYEISAKVERGAWQCVLIDLNDENYIISEVARSSKSRFTHLSISVGEGERAYLDTVITYKENGVALTKFGGLWTAYGCTFVDGVLALENGVTDRGICATLNTTFAQGEGITFVFENKSTASSLTLSYTNGENGKKYLESKKISSIGGKQSITFGIKEGKAENITLTFDDDASGEIIIGGIYPSIAVSGEQNDGVQIVSAIFTSKKIIRVKAKANGLDGQSAFLYVHSGEVDGSPAVASATVVGGEVTFVYEVSSVSSVLLKKFTVGVQYDGGYIYSPYKYATNPEMTSSESLRVSAKTVKGIGVQSNTLITDGVGVVKINLPVGELLTSGSGISYSTLSLPSFTFDMEKTAELDKKIKALENRGIVVIFNVTNEKSGDATLDAMIFEGEGGVKTALCTVCSFLTDRYGITGGTAENLLGIILDTGDIKTASEVSNYADIYRSVYICVKSSNPQTSLYIPLTEKWYSPLTRSGDDISICGFTSLLYDEIKKYGEIPLEYALDIFSSDKTGGDGVLSEYLSADGLDIAEKYLSEKGSAEIIIIGGKEKTEINDAIIQSAVFGRAVLYTLYSSQTITAVVPSFNPDYEETLKYIDTNHIKEKLSYLDEIWTDGAFDLLIQKGAENGALLLENSALTVKPSKNGEAMLIDFSAANGFSVTDDIVSILTGVTIGSKTAITVKFDEASRNLCGIYKEYPTQLDISYAEYLSFGFIISSLSGKSTEADVTVVLKSGSRRLITTGTVKAGGEDAFVIPVGSVDWLNSIDYIGIFLSGIDLGSPELCITDVSVMSSKLSSNEIAEKISNEKKAAVTQTYSLERTVIASALLLLILIVLTVRNVKKRRISGGKNPVIRRLK